MDQWPYTDSSPTLQWDNWLHNGGAKCALLSNQLYRWKPPARRQSLRLHERWWSIWLPFNNPNFSLFHISGMKSLCPTLNTCNHKCNSISITQKFVNNWQYMEGGRATKIEICTMHLETAGTIGYLYSSKRAKLQKSKAGRVKIRRLGSYCHI